MEEMGTPPPSQINMWALSNHKNALPFAKISYFLVVPHITNAVQEWVEKVALTPLQDNNAADVCIIEVYIFFLFFL
jgi:hypothetical protein